MKRFDFIWAGVLLAIAVFVVIPVTNDWFEAATGAHPYIMGFVKYSILATMGELLALRILSGDWKKPVGLPYRALIWGALGMVFVVIFRIFNKGVIAAQAGNLLPALESGFGAALLVSFLTSVFMNLFFAPTFMAFHRVTDTYIDLGEGKLSNILKVKLKDVVSHIDWNSFIGFVVVKTIPIFWIPAHSITFMLPENYRLLYAAFLSIALGGILAFAKKKPKAA
ncbi:MAG: hypothetical protein K0R84_1287 [Clostridia bacterium]|nr:hypothetical protein [Clostridia bacterium]